MYRIRPEASSDAEVNRLRWSLACAECRRPPHVFKDKEGVYLACALHPTAELSEKPQRPDTRAPGSQAQKDIEELWE